MKTITRRTTTITDALNALAVKTMTLKRTPFQTPTARAAATLVAVAALSALAAQPGLCLDAVGGTPDPPTSPFMALLVFIFKIVQVKTVSW